MGHFYNQLLLFVFCDKVYPNTHQKYFWGMREISNYFFLILGGWENLSDPVFCRDTSSNHWGPAYVAGKSQSTPWGW